MKTETVFQEVYINSLGSRVKLRLLSPSEMEALESMNESDREGELILQGIYDPGEVMKQLSNALGSDLVNFMVSRDQETFLDKLRQIKMDILEAICRINELATLQFDSDEVLDTSSGRCILRMDANGNLVISRIDPDCGSDGSCRKDCGHC